MNAFTRDRRLWLLPSGMQELLPPDASRMEVLRRAVLDVFERWSYALVSPSLVEHLDALSVGASAELAAEVLPLNDPVSGRLIGVRTDMTTQVARIDARMAGTRYGAGDAARLAYVGSVLRAGVNEPGSTRNPMQAGAELYGHAGLESDFESVALMLECLRAAQVSPLHVDLGHVGVFGALFADLETQAGLDGEQADSLRETVYLALQRKAAPDVAAALRGVPDSARAARLETLSTLYGAPDVLAHAREALAGAPPEVAGHLEHLSSLAQMLRGAYPDVEVHVDLAELRGFRYHTGLVFAAFTPGVGREIARGGRYDGVGAEFGAVRPATGFSADLRVLAECARDAEDAPNRTVLAPAVSAPLDDALEAAVAALRASGARVVRRLPGTGVAPLGAPPSSELVLRDGRWVEQGTDA